MYNQDFSELLNQVINRLPDKKYVGDEIQLKYCLFCGGGERKDIWSFAMNKNNGAWNCQRGKCNKSGNIYDLAKHFGIDYSGYLKKYHNNQIRKTEKKYIKPTSIVSDFSEKTLKYFQSRKISEKTLNYFKIKEQKNFIAFDFYEFGDVVFRKFRIIGNPATKENKWRREPNGKPIFFNFDNSQDFNEPLIICEGEIEAMTAVECGFKNAVSLPSGTNDLECIDLCWDWLNKFEKIILFMDNDLAGLKCFDILLKKLGAWRCYQIIFEDENIKDGNELLVKCGKEKYIETVNSAKIPDFDNIVKFSEIETINQENIELIPTPFELLNQKINGFEMGNLNLLTGYSGGGKSTLINAFILEAADRNYNSYYYSGELANNKTKIWLLKTASGEHNMITKFSHKYNKDIVVTDYEKVKFIENWLDDKLFINKTGMLSEDDLLNTMEYAFKRYNCKFFVIDNLMSIFLNGNENQELTNQKNFILRLKAFANNNNVIVFLVAHTKKPPILKNNVETEITKYDILGSSNIPNLADLILSIRRKKNIDDFGFTETTELKVLKDRGEGQENYTEHLFFSNPAKRFYELNNPDRLKNKNYKWFLEYEKSIGVENAKQIMQTNKQQKELIEAQKMLENEEIPL